jgi:hypothetical protein
MQHIYSNQLVAYLFQELNADSEQLIEKELETNILLQQELEDLEEGLTFLKKDIPLQPNPKIIENILLASQPEEEAILVD